jgi:uncharacterized protein YjdB
MAGAYPGRKFRRSTMFDRVKLGALLLIGIALPIMGCGSSEVDSLQVTPTAITMVPGATAQLTATGIYGHGTGPSTNSDLTAKVTWSTASADVATVSSTGLVTGVAAGTVTITASINGYGGLLSAASTVTVSGTTTPPVNNDIVTLNIIPGSQTVSSPGDTATYTVTGTTGGGATVNVNGLVVWSSSSTEIATVNASTGVVTATGPGSATISAEYTNADSTVATGTATFTVTGVGSTDNDITAITVIPGGQSVPSPGDTATYVAVGTTGSGSTVSMSGLVTWASSAPQIATINAATGVATAVGQGTSTITAQYVNADKTTATGTATFTVSGSGTTNSDITQVSIVPSGQTVAAPGDTATYTAVGITASGLSENLNGLVVWSASSPQIATINASSGIATAVGQGTTTISAQYTNADSTVATGTATFTVTGSGSQNNDITSITIIPGNQSVPAPGDSATFIALGTSSTGSTVSMSGLVTWTSSSGTIATIDAQTGVATGQAAGTVTITAQYANADKTIATGTASFTVQTGAAETYTALTILPSAQSVSASGQTADFIALATSGTTGLIQDVTNLVTWSSSIPSVATISNTGVVTGVAQGSTTITALLNNTSSSVVTAQASVSVTLTTPPEPILSLSVIPNSITVNDFQLTGQYLAIAPYSSAPYVRDVTNDPNTTWISTEPELFPVDTNTGGNPGASAGLVTAYASGGAVIVAEASSADGTIQTATSTFNCPEVLPLPGVTNPSCYPGETPATTLLETLTLYNEGLNTTNWEVTAPSATGTPDVLHCGPGWTVNGGSGGSVCTATYPTTLGQPTTGVLPVGAAASCPAATATTLSGILITAPDTGAQFGGWSYNCTSTDECGNPVSWTAAGPNYCVVNPTTNDTIGAIFN